MQASKKRILISEDEEDIAFSVKYTLENEGPYDATIARTGESGLSLARESQFDLILLDIMLPGVDGLEVCRVLRSEPATRHLPLLMLTARVEETDKLVGLEIGADDYIAKPFSMKELMARIKAHLRRSGRSAQGGRSRYTAGDLEIDFEGHRVRVEDHDIELTRMEFALLSALAQANGRVLTRSRLLETVWGYEYYGGSRTVDVHVRRLQQKLGACGDCIETVFGVGYRFRDISRGDRVE